MQVVAVVMAGGKGERFWPRSSTAMPKQFLSLWGTGTLLQQAFHRATKITGSLERVYVATGRDYRALVLSQIPSIPPENVIVEPAGRDTAPAIGYAAVYIAQRLPDAIMVVLPSDHVVLDEESFAETLVYAAGVAGSSDYLVTLGIRPTRPEEGYGYIEVGDEVRGFESGALEVAAELTNETAPVRKHTKRCRAFRVKRFTEKPDLNQALEFVRGGKHLWNAGMFAWRLPVIRDALRKHAPSLEAGLRDIETMLALAQPSGATEVEAAVRERFLQLERKSIDYAVLEKADNILVVPADFGWDDVGTWAALERIFDKDENGNVVKGEALAIDASGNIIENSLADKLFVVFGTKNLVIVNSDNVVLVADKRQSGNLKKVTQLLYARDMLGTIPDEKKEAVRRVTLENLK